MLLLLMMMVMMSFLDVVDFRRIYMSKTSNAEQVNRIRHQYCLSVSVSAYDIEYSSLFL